jgi:hypothetical protein
LEGGRKMKIKRIGNRIIFECKEDPVSTIEDPAPGLEGSYPPNINGMFSGNLPTGSSISPISPVTEADRVFFVLREGFRSDPGKSFLADNNITLHEVESVESGDKNENDKK